MLTNTNICLIGTKFMGRAHANAWMKVNKFFSTPTQAVMHSVCGRNVGELDDFAAKWGWNSARGDWKRAIADPAVDLVDITSANDMHAQMAIAALAAGKHVACEKPLAGTIEDARRMLQAARKATKCRTFVWYSYRRTPAVALAHQLVKEGRLGRIYHVRGYYLQDWAKPDVPLLWRFSKKVSGSGSHGDLGAHIIDMARFITGDEFACVDGCIQETFVKQRELPSVGSKGGIAGGSAGKAGKKGRVDVDDATLFLAHMAGGAVASMEATRFATGNQNKNGVEINGEKGSVMFDFMDMNYLSYYDATLPRKVQGWQKINVTHAPDHPYAAAWWPDAHIIGYEHTFINQAADILTALAGRAPVVPLPDFADAYKTQQVLEAASISARERRPVKIAEVG